MQKLDMSVPNRRLIELCQAIGFGRITFRTKGGGPDLNRPWRSIQTVKLAGGENGPRPEADSTDFELRKEHIALVEQLASLDDGVQVTVEVKHGLPFIIEIDQEHEAA